MVFVLNAKSGSVLTAIPVGEAPEGGALDPTDGDVFVMNYLSWNVSIISGVTNEVVRTVPLPGMPFSIFVDDFTGNVFVSTELFNQSRNPQTYNQTETMIAGSSLNSVSSNEFYSDYYQGVVAAIPIGVVVLTEGNLTIINASNNAPMEVIGVPSDAGYAAYDSQNGKLFLTSFYPGMLTILTSAPTLPRPASSAVDWAPPGTTGYVVGGVVGGLATFYWIRTRPLPHESPE